MDDQPYQGIGQWWAAQRRAAQENEPRADADEPDKEAET